MITPNRGIYQPTTTSSNFIVVRDSDIGDMLFGCPPEVVKYFNREKEPIPPNIIIPQRTFRKGINYFDLEFVAYTVIFFQQNKNPINIACTYSQEQRIRIVLQVALFGPLFKETFHSFLIEPLKKFHFNARQRTSLEKIVENIGSNNEIFSQFKEIMEQRIEKPNILAKMEIVLRLYLEKISWLGGFVHKRIYRLITSAYVNAAMLKREMDVFAVCSEDKRTNFIDNFVRFHHFDSNGEVTFTGKSGVKLKIHQTRIGTFKLYKKRKLIDNFDLPLTYENKELINIAKAPMEIPELGITFVGSGTGFDPDTYTSCFIIWINGKAIAVDLLANCENHFRHLGIASGDINHIFISHLHGDHDAGLLEKLMIGEKTYLLTSHLIFDSFLRKAEALTRFTAESITDFVNFVNLDTGKEIGIPGIEGAYITFDYAFHSIPTGRFKLRYKRSNGKELKIGFSGDTKYDPEKVNKLYRDRIITAARRDSILGFLWDCDLIVHEAGGGILHTEVKDLMDLPEKIRKKCILTHTDLNTRKLKGFCFASEGETISLIKKKYSPSINDIIPLIKNTGLFPKFTSRQFDHLLEGCSIEDYSKGKYVFKQGDAGHKFYIILSGFAEVIKDDKVISIYGKGTFLGELALINKDQKRRASIRSKSKLQLLGISRSFYNKFHLSTTIRERLYELTDFFRGSANTSLIGYISRGEFMIFEKGEEIITFGTTSKDVYILICGEVDVIDSGGRLIAHVTDVEVLGEIAFLKHVPRPATVKVASQQATAIKLNAKLFSKIYEKFPSFYATVLKKMDRQMEIFRKQT